MKSQSTSFPDRTKFQWAIPFLYRAGQSFSKCAVIPGILLLVFLVLKVSGRPPQVLKSAAYYPTRGPATNNLYLCSQIKCQDTTIVL